MQTGYISENMYIVEKCIICVRYYPAIYENMYFKNHVKTECFISCVLQRVVQSPFILAHQMFTWPLGPLPVAVDARPSLTAPGDAKLSAHGIPFTQTQRHTDLFPPVPHPMHMLGMLCQAGTSISNPSLVLELSPNFRMSEVCLSERWNETICTEPQSSTELLRWLPPRICI